MAVLEDKKLDPAQQLVRLTAEVQALREQLRQAQRLASVGTMTAMIAHEFNNILTPVINYAQMAQKNPSLTNKAILRAADGGQRATHICQAILEMTRGSSPACEQLDLRALIDETLAAMGRDPQKDRIELEMDIPGEFSICARKVELQQVFLNLILNARNAIIAQGHGGTRRIEITARTDENTNTISVSDTGIGIAPDNLQRIFEPFFTTRSEQNGDSKGNGLGLALSKDIITAMNGEIRVESEVGKGTTFTIVLPK